MAKAKKKTESLLDYDQMKRRAMAAWFRSGGIDQPASNSGVEEYDDKYYVVLRNVNGVMAVYRIRNDDSLKRLKRWPKEVE
jgi:hypothetical protein